MFAPFQILIQFFMYRNNHMEGDEDLEWASEDDEKSERQQF